jgi:hypothetical protein
MINHREIAKKYLEAGVFLYPTQFYEIHCISAVKAQLAECKMATSDAFALDETVQCKKVHTDCRRWYAKENAFGDTRHNSDYLDIIENGEIGNKNWAKEKYNWNNIVSQWLSEI